MDKIQANMIIEVLGRPPEHIKEAVSNLIKKLGEEKGIKVIESKIHEPSPIKESKDLYTTFAEISIEFDSLENYFGIIFSYMPANIEIISPTNFSISNAELNELGNKIIARLHDYDAITKKFIYERNFLMKKLQEVAPNLFKNHEEKSEAEDSSKKSKKPEKSK